MSTNEKVITIGAAAGAIFLLIAAWLAGFDFNERGFNAVMTYLLTIFCAATGGGISYLAWGD